MSTEQATRNEADDECVCLSHGPDFCDYGGDHDEPFLDSIATGTEEERP